MNTETVDQKFIRANLDRRYLCQYQNEIFISLAHLISGELAVKLNNIVLPVEQLNDIKLITFETKYTRDKLIELCEKSLVPCYFWSTKNTYKHQMQLAMCRHLLLCEAEFVIDASEKLINLTFTFKEYTGKYFIPTEYLLKTSRVDWSDSLTKE